MLMQEINYKKKENEDSPDIKASMDEAIKSLFDYGISFEIVRLMVDRISVYDSTSEEICSLKEKETSVKSSDLDISEGAIIIDFKY